MLVSDDGDVWLRRGDIDNEPIDERCVLRDGNTTWDRFDAQGNFIGAITLPRVFDPLRLTSDGVLGVVRSRVPGLVILGLRVEG